MTKKLSKNIDNTTENFYKLSIQVSLNGLSFCIVDTLRNTILQSQKRQFGKELSPFEVQRELKEMLTEFEVEDFDIEDTVVIHRNNLFSLVPKSLFDPDDLANYLKLNAKILANDVIEYDEIENHDLVIVYVPYMNINNYIFDLFGEFEFVHNGTVLLQSLLKSSANITEPVCYVHVGQQQMDLVVLGRKRLLLYNSFQYRTKEDFIYYILFTLEQLDLDPESISLRLFGQIEEEDELYSISYEFIRHISIFVPELSYTADKDQVSEKNLDYTVINAL